MTYSRVIKGVLIEPVAVTDDDFKRFMSSTYPQLVAQDDASLQPQRQPTPRSPGPAPAAKQAAAEGTTIFLGKGCNECGGKGVRGRVGVYEVMKVTPRLRAMIGSASRSEDIHAAAVEEGMVDLKRYSAWLLTEGLTSVEEVTSVVSVDI